MHLSIGAAVAWPRSVPIRAYFAAHFATCPLSFHFHVPVGPGLPLSPAFRAREKICIFDFRAWKSELTSSPSQRRLGRGEEVPVFRVAEPFRHASEEPMGDAGGNVLPG